LSRAALVWLAAPSVPHRRSLEAWRPREPGVSEALRLERISGSYERFHERLLFDPYPCALPGSKRLLPAPPTDLGSAGIETLGYAHELVLRAAVTELSPALSVALENNG